MYQTNINQFLINTQTLILQSVAVAGGNVNVEGRDNLKVCPQCKELD